MRALFSPGGVREQLTKLAYIDSPNLICSNSEQIFRLENFPHGFNIVTATTWTSSPGIQIVSHSETQITINVGRQISPGNGWVRATLSNGDVLTKTFQYDGYEPLTIYVSRNGSCSRIFANLSGGPGVRLYGI